MKRLSWFQNAAIAILLWSTLAYLGTLVSGVPPFFLLAVAFLTGSVLSLKSWKTWFSSPGVLAFGVASFFSYHLFLFLALRWAPAVESNLINYLWPVLIVFISPLLLKGYRLEARHFLGGAIAFLGAGLAVSGGEVHFAAQNWPGYGLAFLAAITWALYSVLSKRLSSVPTATVGGFCFFSGLLALVLHLAFEPRVILSFAELRILLLLGLGPMGAAFYCWDRAIKEGDPRVVGGLSYFTPLLSSFFLIVLGNRALTPSIGLSVALIVTGATLGSLEKKKASGISMIPPAS